VHGFKRHFSVVCDVDCLVVMALCMCTSIGACFRAVFPVLAVLCWMMKLGEWAYALLHVSCS